MDYTQSSGFAIDAGTTNRMHLQAQAVPTAVSDNDMNMVIWEAMEIVKAAGLAGAPFDKATPATYTKLLTALRAAGVFTTPPQFDNSTKAATTGFVKTAGGGFSGVFYLGSTQALSVTYIGALLQLPVAGVVITLPSASATPVGTSFWFTAAGLASGSVTIQGQGADGIIRGANVTANTLTLYPNDTCAVVNIGGVWLVSVSPDSLLGSAPIFAFNVAASGYQKLPGGFILQRGSFVTSTSGDVAVTFPISFLQSCDQILLGGQAIGSGNFVNYNTPTGTGFNGNGWSVSATRAAVTASYLALGK